MSAARYPPVFATNYRPSGPTVADAFSEMLREAAGPGNYSVAIASSYFDLGGWLMVKDDLCSAERVRLLLGTAPDPDAESSGYRTPPSPNPSSMQEWITTERDRVSFTTADDQNVRALIEWLLSQDIHGQRRVDVRRPTGTFLYCKALIVEHKIPALTAAMAGSANLTKAGLSRNKELVVACQPQTETTDEVIRWFNTHWGDAEPFDLADLFVQRIREHPPELIYARMLAEYYGQDTGPEIAPAGTADLSLTGWQESGAETALEMMEAYGGALLADDVGLGKTHTAAKVISHYTRRRERGVPAPRVLVVCPAAMEATWEEVLDEQGVRSRVKVLSYEKARRREIHKDQAELDKYAMVVCDEAHHLRNPKTKRTQEIDRLIAGGNGSPKHALMMTATPVNNGIGDLESIISLAVRDDETFLGRGIPSLRRYLKSAKRLDNHGLLRPEHVEDLMDSFAIRHTRRFVEDTYPGTQLDDGTPVEFPERRIHKLTYQTDKSGEALLVALEKAIIGVPDVDEHDDADYILSGRLIFALYRPARYAASAGASIDEEEAIENNQLTDRFTDGFLRTLLLKRLDSSPYALACTLGRMSKRHGEAFRVLRSGCLPSISFISLSSHDLSVLANHLDDDDDEGGDDNDQAGGDGNPGNGYNLVRMREAVEHDYAILKRLKELADQAAISDPKRLALAECLRHQAAAARPINAQDNGRLARKTLVFTESADSAANLAEWICRKVQNAPPGDPLQKFQGRVPEQAVTGKTRSTHADIVESFDPDVAQRGADRYDLIIATDTIAEGVNLQAAGRCINYDLPWNPMKVVQRFGRVDRLKSPHRTVDLRCFYPGERIDDWLRLLGKLNQKLSAADAAVGVEKILESDHPASGGKTFNEQKAVEEGNDDLESLIDNEIVAQPRSSQEMKYRLGQLREEFGSDVDELPHTAGSGFATVYESATRSAYVFCMRLGDDGPVWFRTVFCERDWTPLVRHDRERNADLSLNLAPHLAMDIDREHSTALTWADPDPDGRDPLPRHLPNAAYAGAFTAWEHARAHAYDDYQKQLGEQQAAQPPAAFRKASAHLEVLGRRSEPVRNRLATVPLSSNPEKEIQKRLKDYDRGRYQAEGLLREVKDILDRHGIEARKSRVGLTPDLRQEDIRLICWQAISPSAA